MAMRQCCIDANRPANDATATALLEALFQHYPPRAMEGGQKRLWSDWLEDVGHLPAEVLADTCRAWRRGDNRWAPAPGQLLALVDGSYLFDLRVIDLALKALNHKPA